FLDDLINVRDASDTAAHLYRHVDGPHDIANHVAVSRGPSEGSVEIDHMNQLGPLLLVLKRYGYGFLIVNGGAVFATLDEAHHAARFQIDCWYYSHLPAIWCPKCSGSGIHLSDSKHITYWRRFASAWSPGQPGTKDRRA